MADFDVFIAGAGPGGCATAISLADFAPRLRVCLADDRAGGAHPLGETLPPPAMAFLKHLGLRARFAAGGHAAAGSTRSAWGSPELIANEFFLGVDQFGWRLDRARFDAMLAHGARERGVQRLAARVVRAEYRDDLWTLRLGGGAQCTARFVVDATGRAAAVARGLGGTAEYRDRLIASVVRFEGCAAEPSEMTVEAFADGWWYGMSLPNGERVLACMTDSDIVRERGLADLDAWRALLSRSAFARHLVAGGRAADVPRLLAAGSRHRRAPAGLAVLAVGDAASCFDPLSSQGIVKALRSGIFASYSIADFLERGDGRGVARYRLFLEREFDAYRRTLCDYYSREKRWPDRPFWRRRQSRQDLSPDAA